MKKLTQIFKNGSGKTKLFVVALAATITVASGVAFAGFGPVRATYDYNDPVDRKGSLIGPVFNSFLNTPSYGDERNFDRIAPVTAGQSPNLANFSEQTTATDGQEYWVRTFVHNNANQSTNCLPEHKDATGNCTQVDNNALGIAKNTNVRVAIADGAATGVDVMSYISADNAKDKNGAPQTTVWDSATLVNPAERFSVSYVPGSAIIYNGAHQSGMALPDAIASSTGTPLGYDQMNGNLPGCFDFSAYVYVKVKVSAPKLELVKQVRLAGTTEWKKSVDAKPGDTVQWLVKVTNTGSTRQTNVVASDLSPLHVNYVAGTAKWYNSQQPNGVAYDYNQFIIDNGNGGIIFGNYAPNGGGFLVRFDTVVKDDFSSCAVTIRNTAHSKSDQQTTELTDTADVIITKQNCQPKVENCTVPGKETLPKNSPECKVVPPATVVTTKPTALPNTGAGNIVGIFASVSVAGAVAHRLYWVRRAARGL